MLNGDGVWRGVKKSIVGECMPSSLVFVVDVGSDICRGQGCTMERDGRIGRDGQNDAYSGLGEVYL